MKPISDETFLCNSIYLESEICDLCSKKNNIFCEERAYGTTQGILQEYSHADLKRRCDIWLMFPALREAFDNMGRDA
jgi:hypothetical protein